MSNSEYAIDIFIATSFLACSILFAISELKMIRIARQSREVLTADSAAWAKPHFIAYLVLVVVSLLAFPAALVTLFVSFSIAPWQIMWPSAGLFIIDGIGGLTFAARLVTAPKLQWIGTGIGFVVGLILAFVAIYII